MSRIGKFSGRKSTCRGLWGQGCGRWASARGHRVSPLSQTAGAGGLKLAKWVGGTLLPVGPGLSMLAPNRATGLMR